MVRAGVQIRVTPGITAGIGGLAYAGIPVTHRDTNQTLTFITGHDQKGASPGSINWNGVASGSHTIVMYMAIKHLRKITERLIAAGCRPDEPVAVVCNATLPDQDVIEATLDGIADEVERRAISAPAVICVGQNVLLRKAINWIAQLQGRIAGIARSSFVAVCRCPDSNNSRRDSPESSFPHAHPPRERRP